MGENALPIVTGIASGGIGALPGAIVNNQGGGSSAAPAPHITGFVGQQVPPSSQNIFGVYDKVLPQSWNQGQPITDPSSILNAYTKNLPAITAGAQKTNIEGGNAQLPAINPVQMPWTWQQWLQNPTKQ